MIVRARDSTINSTAGYFRLLFHLAGAISDLEISRFPVVLLDLTNHYEWLDLSRVLIREWFRYTTYCSEIHSSLQYDDDFIRNPLRYSISDVVVLVPIYY